MPRFPPWEGSSLNLKRPQDAPVETVGWTPPVRSGGLDSPPLLPLLQSMTSEQSFLDMFQSISTQSITVNQIASRAALKADRALNSTTLPSETEGHKATPLALYRPENSKPSTSCEDTDPRRSKSHAVPPLRQMSDSSRTSRSKQSDTFSDQSRPSSRSSNEDLIRPTRQCLEPMLSMAGGGAQPQMRHYSKSKSTLLAPKPANPRQSTRSSSLPSTVVQDKRPQLPQPSDLEHLSRPKNAGYPPGSTSLISVTSRPKRGARLGRQMIARYNEANESTALTLKASSRKTPIGRNRDQTRNNLNLEPNNQADVTERVLLGILSNVSSLNDLRSAAMINKEFYNVFRRHERHLVGRVLLAVSLPAWELRQIMNLEQKRSAFKLRSLQRDMETVRALQSFILMKCQSSCRNSTIDALLDETSARKAELDDAIWRIWMFCKLFGKHRGSMELKAQMLWLRGGYQKEHRASKNAMLDIGSGTALSVRELEDISEMWQCLEMLLAGFKGRELDARKAGVFDNCVIENDNGHTEQALLDMWIYDILSLGPKAVLTLSSCSFEQARVLGITRWTPPSDGHVRMKFLKTAVEEVYREQLIAEARVKAMEFSKEIRQYAKDRRVVSDSMVVSQHDMRRLRTLSITTSSQSGHQSSEQSTRPEEHIDVRPDCDPLSPISSYPSGPVNSPTTNPAAFSSLSLTPMASARLGATLFPVQYQTADGTPVHATHDHSTHSTENSVTSPQIIDPVDKALSYLVKQLGHSDAAAKRALAMCDNGRSIDIHKAVELLTAGSTTASNIGHGVTPELPAAPVEPSSSSSWAVGESHVGEYHTEIPTQPPMSQDAAPGKRNRLKRTSMRKVSPLGVILDTGEGGESEDEVYSRRDTIYDQTALNHRTLGPLPFHHNLFEAVKHSIQSSNSTARQDNNYRGQSQMSSADVNPVKVDKESMAVPSIEGRQTPTEVQTSLRPHSIGYLETVSEEISRSPRKPRVVLTRVGTGKRPSKRWSFKEGVKRRDGRPAEIIGYAY